MQGGGGALEGRDSEDAADVVRQVVREQLRAHRGSGLKVQGWGYIRWASYRWADVPSHE